MQHVLRVLAFLATGLSTASAAHGFGPGNCVSLSRSDAGSCILHTKCGGQDVSKFDFSFDCVSQKGRETHSLGVGTFDEEEEYDTDLKCDECLPSKSSLLQRKAARKSLRKKHQSVSRGMSLAAIAHTTKVEQSQKGSGAEPDIQWYGPENCVGTYRDADSGNCVIKTNCDKDTQLEVYEFGLICAGKDNELTRHLFGMGSFGHKEAFKTDVSCEQCMALDEHMDSDKAISKLTDTVKELREELEGVNNKVDKLSSKVLKEPGSKDWVVVSSTQGDTSENSTDADTKPETKTPTPIKPAPDTDTKKADAKSANFLVRQAQVSQKQPAKEQEVPKPKAPQTANLGKDVTGVTDGGHEVQHVKQKASQGKKAEPSVQAILAAAIQGAAKRGDVPKKVVNNLAQVASKVPQAQQQQTVEADVVEGQDDGDQQSQDSQDQQSQEKDDSKSQKEDQNSQQEEEAQSDDGQGDD